MFGTYSYVKTMRMVIKSVSLPTLCGLDSRGSWRAVYTITLFTLDRIYCLVLIVLTIFLRRDYANGSKVSFIATPVRFIVRAVERVVTLLLYQSLTEGNTNRSDISVIAAPRCLPCCLWERQLNNDRLKWFVFGQLCWLYHTDWFTTSKFLFGVIVVALVVKFFFVVSSVHLFS